MLDLCWATVADAPQNQHWVNVSCLLGISRGEGWWRFCRGQIIYFNPARGALKILNFNTCLNRTIHEVLFHTESAQKMFVSKILQHPRPVEIECWPPYRRWARAWHARTVFGWKWQCVEYQPKYSIKPPLGQFSLSVRNIYISTLCKNV